MVCKGKELVKQKGILSTPNPGHGHALAVETTDLVQRFYESDEVSEISSQARYSDYSLLEMF